LLSHQSFNASQNGTSNQNIQLSFINFHQSHSNHICICALATALGQNNQELRLIKDSNHIGSFCAINITEYNIQFVAIFCTNCHAAIAVAHL